MTRPDARLLAGVLLLAAQATVVDELRADEKLDAQFETLDAAFVAFLAEEAQDGQQNEQETELAAWLRDWWEPADATAAKRSETAHENH